MPEIADCNFNIDDILNCKYSQERVSILTYFISVTDPATDAKIDIEEEVAERLNLYKIIYKHKRKLREIFISYNLEAMKVSKDILSMNLVSFIKLLSDIMLINEHFDPIDAVKIFYVTFSNIKTKAQEASKS